MKKRNLIILLFLLCQQTFAQENSTKKTATGTNRVNLSITPQLYLNRAGLNNDGNAPEVLSTKNTWGHNFGIDYQRTTRYGLILNAGLYYGYQQYNVNIKYNGFGFFDPRATEQLESLRVDTTFTSDFTYGSLKLMIGYKWQLPLSKTTKKWFLELKAGLSVRLNSGKYMKKSGYWSLIYDLNDSLAVFALNVANYSVSSEVGRGPVWGPNWSQTLNFHLGLCKEVDLAFIKDCSVAIEATYRLLGGSIGEAQSRTWNINRKLISQDSYESKDFSIGLRLAFGLWYR